MDHIGITFTALFSKATTTVDGGWNVTFSVNQEEADQIMELSQLRAIMLQVAVVPLEVNE